MTDLKPEYCPTQSGTFSAYRPEYKNKKAQKWESIPIKHTGRGLPYPRQFGGVMSTIFLFGYAQAKAFMWSWSALAEGVGRNIDVRIVEYEVSYDIKAKVIENKGGKKGENDV